jgi:hypothetical protein
LGSSLNPEAARLSPSTKKEIAKKRKNRSRVLLHERRKNNPTTTQAMAMAQSVWEKA